MSRAWLLGVALALAGCSSHEKLAADDRGVSEEEVHAAGASDDAELTPHLHHILTHRAEYSTEVVVATLVSLAERKDPASVGPVAGLAGDEDEEVRYHVALALRALGGEEAARALQRLAADDPSELVREAAGAR